MGNMEAPGGADNEALDRWQSVLDGLDGLINLLTIAKGDLGGLLARLDLLPVDVQLPNGKIDFARIERALAEEAARSQSSPD